jgi:hypothetical protein
MKTGSDAMREAVADAILLRASLGATVQAEAAIRAVYGELERQGFAVVKKSPEVSATNHPSLSA